MIEVSITKAHPTGRFGILGFIGGGTISETRYSRVTLLYSLVVVLSLALARVLVTLISTRVSVTGAYRYYFCLTLLAMADLKLHAYQERAIEFCMDNPSAYLAIDMGLGKNRNQPQSYRAA